MHTAVDRSVIEMAVLPLVATTSINQGSREILPRYTSMMIRLTSDCLNLGFLSVGDFQFVDVAC